MRRLVQASPAEWQELEQRSHGACVVFNDQELPQGCSPARARVGLESHHGQAVLYVERDVSYDGSNAAVAAWLAAGRKDFNSWDELIAWVRSLAPHLEPTPNATPTMTQLTDLDAIELDDSDDHAPKFVSQDALLTELRQTVRGQEPALTLLARRVSQHLARRSPRRPLNLFAIGPTGVGKTSAAQALATALRTLGVSEYGFLRLDMNQYAESHRVSELLGSPQGYIGYGEGALLADALAANPRLVVLFDEIEKAHPTILQVLMNAMDAGRLTVPARSSGRDRTLQLQQAILFFTSNLDSDGVISELQERDAFGDASTCDEVVRRRLQAAGIKPELLGRITATLVFQPLSQRARAEVAVLAIVRAAADYDLDVTYVSPDVVSAVLRQSLGTLGARPIEYAVDDVLTDHFVSAARRGLRRIAVAGPPVEVLPAEELRTQRPLN